MRDYRRLWTGTASSNLADGVTFVALPLLAVTLTRDPVEISALTVAYTVARLLSVLGIGVLVDRVDRRLLLQGASFSRGALFAVLTMLVVSGHLSMVALYAVYALMGVLETLADGAAVAILPQVVPTARLDRANSQITGTQVVVDEFLGPPLGGFLVGLATFAPSLLTTAALTVAGLAYLGLRGSYALPASQENQGVAHQVTHSARWTWRNGLLRTLVVVGGLASVGYMIPFSYLVLYTREVLGLGPTGYGLLLSVSAVGGVLGSIVAAPVRRRVGYCATTAGALLVGAASFAVISVVDALWVVGVALSLYIAHAVVWNVMSASMRQKATPAAMMGRVGAVGRFVSITGLAVGAGLGGLLARHLGYQAPFAVAAVFFAVGALLVVLARRHVAGFDDDRPGEQP